MGIENKMIVCPGCDRSDLLGIELLDMDIVPEQYIDVERDKKGDLFCPSCRVKVISVHKAENDKTYVYFKYDFNDRKARIKAREDRIRENDTVS